MIKAKIHLFSGHFPDPDSGYSFAEEKWKEEPQGVSEDEYLKWEMENPEWPLKDELGVNYLSPDFIDVRFGESGLSYLREIILSDDEYNNLVSKLDASHNTYILIGQESLNGNTVPLQSTSRLSYNGVFLCRV